MDATKLPNYEVKMLRYRIVQHSTKEKKSCLLLREYITYLKRILEHCNMKNLEHTHVFQRNLHAHNILTSLF